MREKLNREREEDGLSPLPTPETAPDPDLSPSGSEVADYSTLGTPNTEVAGGQSSGQWRAGTVPPAPVVGESTHARMTGERTPAWPGVENLGRVSPPRHQVGLGARPIGCSTGAGGLVRATRSGSRKRKLDAAPR